jgi:hypothetical protein
VIGLQKPDFFSRADLFEEYVALFALDNNKPIGSAVGAIKNIWLNDAFVKSGYIFDVKVHPDYRRQGIAGQLIQESESLMECELLYAFILQNNEPAMSLFSNQGYSKIGEFSLVVMPTTERVKSIDEKIDIENIGIQSFNPVQFYPHEYHKSMQRFFSGEDGLYQIYNNENKMKVILFDYSKVFGEKVLGLPKLYEYLRPIFKSLEARIDLPQIPQIGEVRGSYYVVMPPNEEFFPELFKNFLVYINNLARDKGIDQIIFATADPTKDIRGSFLRMLLTPVQENLYVKGNQIHSSEEMFFDVRDV